MTFELFVADVDEDSNTGKLVNVNVVVIVEGTMDVSVIGVLYNDTTSLRT